MGEKQFGLLGRKLGHSFSPKIHSLLGDYPYDLFEVEPEDVEDFLCRGDFSGLNVTIPYKKTVIPFCAQLSPAAQRIGSVNTLLRREDGTLYGDNTDYDGFLYLLKSAGAQVAGKKALVLGSGGASLTVRTVLVDLGAGEVVVISRTGENNYQNLHRHADAQLIVNTTPVGMYPNTGVSPVDLGLFPQCEGAFDLIYNPARTQFLLDGQRRGMLWANGLGMLVAQAKAAEEHFFSRTIADGENERILSALRHQMENIVLIGMPGCGKSTVGAALAALTGREAVDIDAEIERRAGCTIPEIFARGGEAEFRRLEHQATAEAGKRTGCILLTGGGVVKTPENYGALRQNGRIYHLLRDVDALPTDGRPLSQGADLAAMWQARKPLYERFRDTVIDNNGPAEETAQAIWRDFCAYSGD